MDDERRRKEEEKEEEEHVEGRGIELIRRMWRRRVRRCERVCVWGWVGGGWGG